ncbi:hypothetical protein GCM10020358_58950 [Amorphoplanes nipponensis]|uniref:TIR domain-containing protein n=1 Tax=Actinoplanes nipponensis TaxID=135950 RepID=A0A919JCX7_9ACTN|nr:toll/interleukin-1 receptor domain-containing protein [Actinoplanes nipponensis]GIE46876.1 hypothetical protein Ani05nite_04100 [Actinoplanes nipponensis]
MRVFISWSGEPSRHLAHLLVDWLPLLVPGVKPWMSDNDLAKGVPWREELFAQLRETAQGIVCVTPENVASPWLNFEAGSLAKAVNDKAYVWTLLLHIAKADVTGPLASFQATTVHDRSDFLGLVRALNAQVSDPQPGQRLERLFDKFWPEFGEQVTAIPLPQPVAQAPNRSERDLLEEILTLVRSMPHTGHTGHAGAAPLPDPADFPRVSNVPPTESSGDVDQRLG